MNSSLQELTYLLKSKAKCIWIKTYEEQRAINDIKSILLTNFTNTKLYSWSFFEGLQEEPLTKIEQKTPTEKGISPDALLDRIIETQAKGTIRKEMINGKLSNNIVDKDENIWVLKDFHLCNETKSVLRGIRDAKERNSKEMLGYNPIIIISPIVNIPIEHEKLFTIVDYDTPNNLEIKNYLTAIVNKLKQDSKYTIPTDDELNSCINLAKGLTLDEITHYCNRSIVKYNTLSPKTFYEARTDLIKKTGILEYHDANSGLSDMGGNEAFKAWVDDIKDTFTPEAQAFGVGKPKGYLAVGIAGTSKTLSAEIMANTLNLPLLKFKISKVMHSHVGKSEQNMDNALRIVKSCSPCVLLIDEIEKVLGGVISSNAVDGGTLSRVMGSLLEYLGSEDSKDTFTIMTSNNSSSLPPELTRSGRIDTIWYFGLPTDKEREEIFRIHFEKSNMQLEEGIIKYAADKSINLTGAEIKETVKVAIRKAFKRFKIDGNSKITSKDIDEAIPEIIPVYESSKEKISMLEEYYKTRSRFSNTISKVEEIESYDNDDDDNDIIDFDINV